ncbi:hypothetical protein [Algoriphagus sp.]|uniref:hypothetical protein n=1 Tax=Algoriphagus sp. TaxID=1872435 RepID=UPI00262686C2|nr:hypothetical protein [Algoriphagus sp.]
MEKISRKQEVNRFPRWVISYLSESYYQELKAILSQDPSLSMSELIRSILMRRQIRIQVQERGLSDVMEVLLSVEAQLKKVENKVTVVVSEFQGNSNSLQKFLLAKKLRGFQRSLQGEMKHLEQMLEKLQLKWLSE